MFLGIVFYYIFIKYVVIRYLPFFLSFLLTIILTSYFKKKKYLGLFTLVVVYLFTFFLLFCAFFYGIKYLYVVLIEVKDYYDLYLIPLINDFMDYFKSFGADSILLYGQNYLDSLFVFVIDSLITVLSFIPSLFQFFILFIISSFIIYNGYDELKKYLLDNVSASNLIQIRNILIFSIKNYLLTQLEITFVIFLILFFSFRILSFKNVFLLSLLTALIDMIPLIGVGIIIIPIAIYYLLLNNYIGFIYILLIYFLVNITRTFLEPKLMKNKMNFPEVLLFVSMIIHLELFGFFGIFISPISMSILHTLLDKNNQKK